MATKSKSKKKAAKPLKTTIEKVMNALKPKERDYEITAASIKEMACNYDLHITGEVNHGWKNKEKGEGIVDKDMLNAMAAFNVHLACLDDAFKIAGIEFEDIDTMRGHELTANYVVTGFKIKGGKGNEQLILIGSKYISLAGDHMQLATPKIPLNQSSSYTWHNELSACTEAIREEVSLYREGKYTEKEPKEKGGENQMKMFDAQLVGKELDDALEADKDNAEQFPT